MKVTRLSAPKAVGSTVCPVADFNRRLRTIINKIAPTNTKIIIVRIPMTTPMYCLESAFDRRLSVDTEKNN